MGSLRERYSEHVLLAIVENRNSRSDCQLEERAAPAAAAAAVSFNNVLYE